MTRKIKAVFIQLFFLLGTLNSLSVYSQTSGKFNRDVEGCFEYWLKGMEECSITIGATSSNFLVFQRFYESKIDAERAKFMLGMDKGPIDAVTINEKMKQEENTIADLYKQFLNVEREFPSSIDEYRHPFHGVENICDSAGCTNIGFEQGNLSGWSAYYAYNNNSGNNGFFNVTKITGGVAGAVTEAANDTLTSTPGYFNPTVGVNSRPDYQIKITHGPQSDALVPVMPQVSPFGGSYSVMLGDSTEVNYGVAILSKSFYVTALNDNFTYQYALLIENPLSHNYYQQPFFKAAVLDENGDTIPYCGEYTVVSRSGLPGFHAIYYPKSKDSVYYKNWVSVSVPLKKYIGTCVTVVFESGDCALGGHFGYAYVDASCVPLGIITSSPSICGHNNITLTAPAGFSQYQWTGPSPGSIVSSTDTTQAVSVNSAGTYSVVVTPVTGSACADTLYITISKAIGITPTPAFTADSVCVGQATSFTNTSVPAGGKFYWDFYNIGTYQDSTANPNWTYNNEGTYFVKLYEVLGGCGADTVIKVQVDSTPIAGFVTNGGCSALPTNFINTTTGGSTYSWNFGDPSSGPANTSILANPMHTYTTTGSYTIALVAKGISGCRDSISKVISIVIPPTVAINGIDSICPGGNTTLTATGSNITDYSWSTTPVQTTQSAVVSANVNTVYTLTVANNLCHITDSFEVYMKPAPSVSIKGNAFVCKGDTITLTATVSTANYVWNTGATTSTITIVQSAIGNTYYVVATQGCSDTTYFTVNTIPGSSVTACCDTSIAYGGVANITASGATSYVWSPSGSITCSTCQNTTATPVINTIYTVTGTDGNVVPCCFDKDAQHPMGNVKEQSFKDLWQSDKYNSFRQALLRSRKEIDICKNCTEGTKVWG